MIKLNTVFTNAAKKAVPLSAVLLLTACGGFGGDERPAYQGAEYYKNLEIPPNLTAPDTAGQTVIPKPSDSTLQQFRENHDLVDTKVSPKFDGVRTSGVDGNSWIEIDGNAEQVWQTLIAFWQTEGVELTATRPLLGFMETQWIERLEADASYLRKLFQRLEPDTKDKFRVRIHSNEKNKTTRLVISHSSIERVFNESESGEYIWQTRASDISAEREMISRLALFVGKTKQDADQLTANYRPYQSLITTDKTDSTSLIMTGSLDFVYARALRALDRMQAKNIKQLSTTSVGFVIGELSHEALKIDDEDELAKSSWLMQLFSSVDDKPLSQNTSRQYRLEFSDKKAHVEITVQDIKNSQSTDEDGNVNSTALTEQLRDILVEELE